MKHLSREHKWTGKQNQPSSQTKLTLIWSNCLINKFKLWRLHFIISDGSDMVKNLSAMQETWVWSFDWENPLEKRMTTHSSILAWKIPWIEEPGGLQSMGLQRVRHDWVTNTFITDIFNISIKLSSHIQRFSREESIPGHPRADSAPTWALSQAGSSLHRLLWD